jgi:arsenate reductase
MIKIYHNPRCSKSRQGLEILKNSNVDFEIIKYLDTPISSAELKEVINKLNINPIDLVRKTEAVWKEQFKGKELSDSEVIQAMVNHPKLIERPIVIGKNKAVIGRPPALILDLF